ncbi:hypothetical protein MMC10_007391 [Thelotrema lepadinum]|nr:hypothetical protein [Thelotrema lepadinum]
MDSILAFSRSLNLSNIFQNLGIATTSYIALRAATAVYWSLRPSAISRCLRQDKDSWALITGASGGIGRACAEELTQKGFHLILHGRNKQKLEGVAEELLRQCPKVQTRIYVVDASSYDESTSFKSLLDMIQDLHVTLLINNVGGDLGGDNAYVYLKDYQKGDIERMINLNAGFTTHVTRALTPTLMKNEPSTILITGSYSYLGFPMLSVYGGTKGYVNSFAESMQLEFMKLGKDVTVHGVLVGSVATEFSGHECSFFTPTPEEMAKGMLGRAGKAPVIMNGYWPHALQGFMVDCMPDWMRQRNFLKIIAKREAYSRSREKEQ